MSKLEYSASFERSISLENWMKLKDILEPYAQKCFDGDITQEEYYRICDEEKEKFVSNYSK